VKKQYYSSEFCWRTAVRTTTTRRIDLLPNVAYTLRFLGKAADSLLANQVADEIGETLTATGLYSEEDSAAPWNRAYSRRRAQREKVNMTARTKWKQPQ
jgi:hypothetical protein